MKDKKIALYSAKDRTITWFSPEGKPMITYYEAKEPMSLNSHTKVTFRTPFPQEENQCGDSTITLPDTVLIELPGGCSGT